MSDYSSSCSVSGFATHSRFQSFKLRKAMMKTQVQQPDAPTKDVSHATNLDPMNFPIIQAPSSSFDDSLSDISEFRATMDALVDGADDVWLHSIVDPKEEGPVKVTDQTAIFSWLTSLSGHSDSNSDSASIPGSAVKDQEVTSSEPPAKEFLVEENQPEFDTLSIGSLLDLDALDDKTLFGVSEEQVASYSAVDIGLFDGFTLEELLEPIESLPTLDRALLEAPDNVRAMLGLMTKQFKEGEKLGLSSLRISENFSGLPSPSVTAPSAIHRKSKSTSDSAPVELPQNRNRLSLGSASQPIMTTLSRSSTILKRDFTSPAPITSPESLLTPVNFASRIKRQASSASLTTRDKASSATKPSVAGNNTKPRPLSINPYTTVNKVSPVKSLAPEINVHPSTPVKSAMSGIRIRPRPLSLNASAPLATQSKPSSPTKSTSGASAKLRPLGLNPLATLNRAPTVKSLAGENSDQPCTHIKSALSSLTTKPRPLSLNPSTLSRVDPTCIINGKTFTSRIPVPSASKRLSVINTFSPDQCQSVRSAGLPAENSAKPNIQAFYEANPNFVSRIPRLSLSRASSDPRRISSIRGL